MLLKELLVVAHGIKSGSLYVTQVKMCGEVNMSEYNLTDLCIYGWVTRVKKTLKFFLRRTMCLVMVLLSPLVYIVWRTNNIV
jgi:hypothetical protein